MVIINIFYIIIAYKNIFPGCVRGNIALYKVWAECYCGVRIYFTWVVFHRVYVSCRKKACNIVN